MGLGISSVKCYSAAMIWRRAFVAAALVTSCSCISAAQWGFPRVPVSAVSPDGRFVALVRNHPDLDPPNQSIWIGRTNAQAEQVQQLGPDSDWCSVIVWSADSTTAAYLIQDARLITIDADSQRILSDTWLTPQDGYPTTRMVEDLSLSANGAQARFRTCDRNVVRASKGVDRTGCSATQMITLRS